MTFSRNPLEITTADTCHTCEAENCKRAAEYVDSQPDSNIQGINASECGYSRRYYCPYHARERWESIGNTSRMTCISEVEE